MSFGKLTYRESVRDIFNYLNTHEKKVYHLGLKYAIGKKKKKQALF